MTNNKQKCEWKPIDQTFGGYPARHNVCNKAVQPARTAYMKFCPYCGGEIVIKEQTNE